MAEKLSNKETVTIKEVLISHPFQIVALVSLLAKKALLVLARAEILERIKTMPLRRAVAGIAIVLLCLNAPATAAMYTIKNPAEKIRNPADKMYNPATQVNNPASNIYNPGTRMDNPNPLSPPTQPVPQPTVPEVTIPTKPAKQINEQPQPKPAIPQKNYYYKTAGAYINAAKKAFNKDDYREFISITEDALRRIRAGTLKVSKKTKQKLVGYKIFGYGLLEKHED